MKVVISIDSFKGSVSSLQAGEAAKEGVTNVFPEAEVIVSPLADGGEGTVEALVHGTNGTKKEAEVVGPIGERVTATYGILGDGTTAVIEVASAAGLPQVPADKRNPLHTTTYGVGELILHAIEEGCREFIIGLGGSATNDAGVGMLQALGFQFLDRNGCDVSYGGGALADVVSISAEHVKPQVKDCTFRIASDVVNPLYGTNGAAYVYGPQKGATADIVKQLDEGLRHVAVVTEQWCGKDWSHHAGAGAAGGLGVAFLAFLGAQMESGIDIVIRETKLQEVMNGATFVITGEGRLDAQTAMGKAPIGVARAANEVGATVIALAGATTDDTYEVNEAGIHSFFSVTNRAMSLEEAMNTKETYKNIRETTTQIFNLIRTVQ